MFWLTTGFASVLLIAATIQLVIAAAFLRYFQGLCRVRQAEDQPVKVAVLMCVRGCDPSLQGGLIRLLQQCYRDYEIHLVIDSQQDTAWQVAHQVKADFDQQQRLQIHELQERHETCGLKCSALVQGLQEIGTDIKYLLLTDSDVITHPAWIADLVGPLEADPQVGLVCGAQWFEPPAGSTWGALVRSSWNAGALVPTIYFRNPWAGTMAMRVADIRQGNFAEVWRQSMVDDGPLANLIQRQGKQIRFAPSLIMVNNENCTFRYSQQWVARMLTWSRLYEPTFHLATLHAVLSNSVMIGLFALWFVAFLGQAWPAALISTVGLIGSGMLSVAAYVLSRKVVQRSCTLSDRQLAPLSMTRVLKLLFTVPLAQLVYLGGVLQASLAKRVRWRGITYEIEGKQVRMTGYAPFQQTQEQTQANTSI